jgi:hypothetical protein
LVEILAQLEYRRRALRRRVLGALTRRDDPYLAVGVAVFIIAAFLTPLFAGTLPPISILAGSLIVIGGVLLFTIILIPARLFLL